MRDKHTSFIIVLVLIFTSSFNLFGQITTYPYVEDFENGDAGWTVNGSTTSWALGFPYIGMENGPASGSNAWATNLNGSYLDFEDGWVESPIFDLSTLSTPFVQFSINWRSYPDAGAVLQYSINSGTWQTLGNLGEGINWYNKSNLTSNPGGQSQGWSGISNDVSDGWVTAIHSLDDLIGETNVIFRVVFASTDNWSWDGFGFDLFSILDNPCYAGEDNHVYICSANETVNLGSFLSPNADSNGDWSTLNGELAVDSNGNVDFTGAPSSGFYRFTYSVTSENGACNDEAVIWVTLEDFNAIYSATLGICQGSGSSLFESDFLNAIGNPQDASNGTWSPDVSGGISESQTGDYTFTFPATSTCPEVSATVTVVVDTPKWAGEDNGGEDPIQECQKDVSYDLNSRLSPLADLGGTWIKVIGDNDINLDSSGNVDFPETGAGSYSYRFKYTTESNACGSDEAFVDVKFEVPSDAGNGNTLILWGSETLTEQRLFEALDGSPDEGGEWSPNESDSNFGDSGDYTYTFTQGDFGNPDPDLFGCQNSSTVSVTVVPVYTNTINIKAFLQGPYDVNSGLMRDNLRVNFAIPNYSEYYNVNYLDYSNYYQDYVEDYVLNGTSADPPEIAIVDWVIVEFWDSTKSIKIMERPALLQRDGDIVDIDGFSTKSFALPADDYFIVVNHRNHVPIMTSSIYSLSGGSLSIDFTTNTSLIYGGVNAITNFGNGSYGLISGSNYSGLVSNQERVYFYNSLGITGYNNRDYDMNGSVEINDVDNYLIPNLGKGKQF